ncbi:MAG: pre-16S rRNA-processing nuclease YqgF [Cyanothece sp. SIO2G6]|nr:pre-16S rRNA-processing nuclease YqgF [Cyanothece sp. SIO2G6]
MLVGFDPGRDKCGIAVVTEDGTVQYRAVVVAEEAIATLEHLCQQFAPTLVVMGDQTTARQWQQTLENHLPIPVVLVDERYSSLEARERYWQLHPPRGLIQLIPQSLRRIPGPIDDIVALILLERWRSQP